jgi:hypothetical protein
VTAPGALLAGLSGRHAAAVEWAVALVPLVFFLSGLIVPK